MMGGLAVAVFRWPAAAIAGVFCTYGLEQWAQSNSSFFASHTALTNYVTALILVEALALRLLRGHRLFTGYPPVGWVTIALFAYVVLSILWSVYPAGTAEQLAKHWPYLTLFALLCPLVVEDGQDLRHGLFAFLVLGSVVVSLLLFTTVSQGRYIQLRSGVGIGSLVSDRGNPLAVATLAGYVTTVAVLMNFSGLARFWQLARWYIVAVGLAVSVRSGSRGQLFALLIATIVFLPLSRRVKSGKGFLTTVAGVLLIAGLAVWAHAMFAEANRWRWDDMAESYTSGRLETTAKLLHFWARSSPIYWVIGLGNSAAFDPFILGFYPHLVMTEVLAEEGIIGLILLWAIVILAFRAVARVYAAAADFPDARGVLASLGALFLFGVILSFKQGSLLGQTAVFAFAIMLGRFEQAVLRTHADVAFDPDQTQPAGPDPRGAYASSGA